MTNQEHIRSQPGYDALKMFHKALKKHGETGIKAWLAQTHEEGKRETVCPKSGVKS